MDEVVSHRPGPLKQKNKAHKTGRHRSKGAIDAAVKGKVSLKVQSFKHKQQQRKEQRKNQLEQIRKNKRQEAVALKRQLGGHNASPFLVTILPLHSKIDANSALAILAGCDQDAIINRSVSGITYINLPRFRQRFAFIIPPIGRGNELRILDYLKVSDTTLLLTSAAMGEEDLIDRWGYRIYNMIAAQGIPTPILALMDLESLNPKRRTNAKAAAQKVLSKILPNEKLMQLDTNSEGLNVMRRIGGQKKSILQYKNNRAFLYSDKVEFIQNPQSNDLGTLKVTGFLRSKPLNVNGLVHIPGLGDYQMLQIDDVQDPYKLEKSNGNLIDSVRILAKADPSKQTSLQSENIPDEMEADQPWPTEEEIETLQKVTKTKHIKRVPKGYSEYQSAWIPDVETVDEANDEDDDVDMDDDDNCDDDNDDDDDDEFMSCDEKSSEDEFEKNKSDGENDNDEYVDSLSEVAVNDEKYDLQIDLQEERDTLKKIKEARADEMWPDEIDTPRDVPAKTRFQKYRGLESFKASPWDKNENLPSDYARIFKFQNFDRTKRRILKAIEENIVDVEPGKYITIHLANMSASHWDAYKITQRSENIILYGILPHEHQMSTINVVLKRTPDSEIPIKSKERMIIQIGYRRFIVNPIFSQHTNGDKHKFERYFRPHTIVCATFFAPIQFPTSPALAFMENPDGSLKLIAHGCLLSCNPDRIILKRIVLSGHPMRINRKSATVRYMFFNKEDVEYFKPVKLRTKCGRLGHIKESLGTHGHMKCYFDGQLRSYDTVFMYLYKRVYSKWTYEEYTVNSRRVSESNQLESIME